MVKMVLKMVCAGASECDRTPLLSRSGIPKNTGVRHGQMTPDVTSRDLTYPIRVMAEILSVNRYI